VELLSPGLNGSKNQLPELFSSGSIEVEHTWLKKGKKKKSNGLYGGWILSMKT